MASLEKIGRHLLDLKATPAFLRQYPALAARLREALETASTPKVTSSSSGGVTKHS